MTVTPRSLWFAPQCKPWLLRRATNSAVIRRDNSPETNWSVRRRFPYSIRQEQASGEEKHRSPSTVSHEHCSLDPQSAALWCGRLGAPQQPLSKHDTDFHAISVKVSQCKLKANTRSTVNKATPITKHPHRWLPTFELSLRPIFLKGLSNLYLSYIFKHVSILYVPSSHFESCISSTWRVD